MVAIIGRSLETGASIITMYASNNLEEINDKIEHIEFYYPELYIEVKN